MNTLFVHDSILINKDNQMYTRGPINTKLIYEYKKFFGDITLLLREKVYTNELEKYIKLENKIEDVKFDTIKSLNFIEIHKKIIKIIKEYDFLIIRLPSFTGLIAALIADKYKIPYLIEMVGCPWDSLWNHGFKGKILAPMITVLTKKIVKKSKYVLYVTDDFLQKRYPTKGNQIGCSDVALPEINKVVLKNRIDKIEQRDKNKIIVGTIGNLDVKYKGHKLVLYAIHILKKRGYNIEYQLVGGGKGKIIKEIAEKLDILDNVIFIGPKPHNEIFSWIDNLDIYIQPSYTEGLCRAVIEAMSRACPCIVSNAGGNIELINQKYITRKGKVNDLVYKLLLLIDDDYNLKEAANQNFYKSFKFNKEKLNKMRENFYTKINTQIDKKNYI